MTGFKDLREAVSQSIGDAVVRGMKRGSPAKHRIMLGGASSYGADDAIFSELFFAPPAGFIIWHLLRTRPGHMGGLLGLGSKEQLAIEVISAAMSLEAADELLVEAASFITTRRADLFPQEVVKSSFIDAETLAFKKAVCGLRDFTSSAEVRFRPDELLLAKKMAHKPYRDFLIRLMQIKSFEEGQLTQEVAGFPNGDEFIDFLVVTGFLERQRLITCGKNGSKLACVAADDGPASYDAIWCPYCTKSYADEKCSLVYSGTASLKTMMKSSRWLSILVAGKLNDLGLPERHMVWDVKFGHEEMDLLAWVNGALWAFELKSDSFDYSDARHFNYRRSLIKPQVAAVVAALGLAPDAKKELDENSESAAFTLLESTSKLPNPLLIDDLESLNATLSDEWKKHEESAQRHAIARAVSGLPTNIAHLLTAFDG